MSLVMIKTTVFGVHSIEIFLFKSFLHVLSSNYCASSKFLGHKIWKFTAPPKVKAFNWDAVLDKQKYYGCASEKVSFYGLVPFNLLFVW